MERTNPAHSQSSVEPKPVVDPKAVDDQIVTDVEQLNRQLAECQGKLDEMRELMLRERAELDNQRKRLVRDLELARKFANERILGELLPVCDNLERGLAVENADISTLRAGMDLTLKELFKVAEANGLKPLNPLGAVFNPEQHQAVNVVHDSQRLPNTVVAVFQKGYMLNERLLRPALVTVAKA